jgi:hypothetical protein
MSAPSHQLEALLSKRIGKYEAKHGGGARADGYFAQSAIGRAGSRSLFIAKSGQAGEDRPKHRIA